MKNVYLKIEGMKCEGCVSRIKKVLSTIKNIGDFEISLEKKELSLVVKNDKILKDVIQKIENLDFEIKEKKI